MPAAHLVWPIWDLTEPSAHARRVGARAREDLGQRRELGAVADDRAGAVRLDEADLRGRDAGGVVGAVEGAHLALLARRGQAEALAVAEPPPTPLITA